MSKALPIPRRCPGHLPGSTGPVPSGFIDFRGLSGSPSALLPRCARIQLVHSLSGTLSDPQDESAAERCLSMVERAHGKSRGLARCLPGELHPPRRRLCKDGATSATRDRSRDRADIVPLKRRGCRAWSLEAYCRRGFIISRRNIDVHFHLASVPDRGSLKTVSLKTGGASSRGRRSLDVRISSQIALFPSLLILGR